jgi:hypothetical protein
MIYFDPSYRRLFALFLLTKKLRKNPGLPFAILQPDQHERRIYNSEKRTSLYSIQYSHLPLKASSLIEVISIVGEERTVAKAESLKIKIQ